MSSKKTRLLQITHDLDVGGLQQVIYNLCRTIDREKYEVSVLCLRERGMYAQDIEDLGIPVILLEKPQGRPDYLAFLKVAKVARALQVDVIHTHNTQPFIDGTLGAILAGVRTVIHTDHARQFPDKRRYMIAEWFMSAYAYRVVGCSEHTTQQLRAYEKIPSRKLATIPNGIDGARFQKDVDKQAKREELGINVQGPVIGLAVRLCDQKGVTYLLNAMPTIVAKHPNVTLLIAGTGELSETLLQEAQRLGVNKNVKFCGVRKDIPEILKILDVYVLPSKWEGLPMVVLEALAAGCPVVATDVGGTSTAVTDRETGLLVPPMNANSLAAAIIQLLDSHELRQRFARNGRAMFEKRFSAEIMTRQYERLYSRQAS